MTLVVHPNVFGRLKVFRLQGVLEVHLALAGLLVLHSSLSNLITFGACMHLLVRT